MIEQRQATTMQPRLGAVFTLETNLKTRLITLLESGDSSL